MGKISRAYLCLHLDTECTMFGRVIWWILLLEFIAANQVPLDWLFPLRELEISVSHCKWPHQNQAMSTYCHLSQAIQSLKYRAELKTKGTGTWNIVPQILYQAMTCKKKMSHSTKRAKITFWPSRSLAILSNFTFENLGCKSGREVGIFHLCL